MLWTRTFLCIFVWLWGSETMAVRGRVVEINPKWSYVLANFPSIPRLFGCASSCGITTASSSHFNPSIFDSMGFTFNCCLANVSSSEGFSSLVSSSRCSTFEFHLWSSNVASLSISTALSQHSLPWLWRDHNVHGYLEFWQYFLLLPVILVCFKYIGQ